MSATKQAETNVYTVFRGGINLLMATDEQVCEWLTREKTRLKMKMRGPAFVVTISRMDDTGYVGRFFIRCQRRTFREALNAAALEVHRHAQTHTAWRRMTTRPRTHY